MNFARTLKAHLADLPKGKRVEIWFQDEARIGQKNGVVRQWAKRGTRPRQPADQRYRNAYLFGAICPARGVGAALVLPYADTDAMQLHLDEISRQVSRRAHAVLLLDRAGWHTTGKLKVPRNITLIFLPSRAPELNPVENVWQYMRANWLSNRVFEDYEAILDAACEAWRKLIAEPCTISSIGLRQWAHVGQSL
ncbi:MAG: IS630 family transposase [Rhodanobacteraceae bacterium]